MTNSSPSLSVSSVAETFRNLNSDHDDTHMIIEIKDWEVDAQIMSSPPGCRCCQGWDNEDFDDCITDIDSQFDVGADAPIAFLHGTNLYNHPQTNDGDEVDRTRSIPMTPIMRVVEIIAPLSAQEA
ncbi:hypothetical protein M422DRAFT_38333, partial [Sphaerobolus stellatus SS14]